MNAVCSVKIPHRIAGHALPEPADFAAARIAIFLASPTVCALGALILWRVPQDVS